MRPLVVVVIWERTGENTVGLEGGEDVVIERSGENGGVDEGRLPVVVGHDRERIEQRRTTCAAHRASGPTVLTP